MKCLLVDDEPGIREGLAMLLRRKGHDVRTAGDCAAAAAALAESAFDLVITDWRLPDGVATCFVADCPSPVVAVSGHPEEVERHACVVEVLTKPVAPSRLLAELAILEDSRRETAVVARLPRDVQRVLDEAAACLPPGTATSIEDDGTFVTWRADLADESPVAALAELGGDLRVLAPPGRLCVELRLCRDGRPDTSIPVVGAQARWPDCQELAVDFHEAAVGVGAFTLCLERASARLSAGRRVHFLNIPESLASLASDWEKANGMPMKEKVGPRLPAVLVDLWS